MTDPAEYPFVYGIMSESTHGSWNESMDWCLSRNDDGTFSALAMYHGVDARAILPLVRYATLPYVLWSDRIQIQDDSMRQTFDRIHDYSARSTIGSTNSTTARPLMVSRPPIRSRRPRSR